MKPLAQMTAISCLLIGLAGAAQAQHNHEMVGHKSRDAETSEVLGLGVVNGVDAQESTVNISHEPIPDIGWPAMTMDIPASRMVDLGTFPAGTKVQFTLKKGRDDIYRIMRMCVTDKAEVVIGLCETADTDAHGAHEHHEP